ncbi:hypothetical protein CTA1_11013 [Colletotrichum tanaceti]|uniref:Uncharacterized protein n=1 Tax=Colletotrichum tanaceti TaxID=1306861 RepID=A0A4U6XEF3_9PEZI|nr:hypothetical protein CTA1_11013 [Colletotrichum tanaceti]
MEVDSHRYKGDQNDDLGGCNCRAEHKCGGAPHAKKLLLPRISMGRIDNVFDYFDGSPFLPTSWGVYRALRKAEKLMATTYAIGTDPERVPGPDKFDGVRQYNNRKRPGERMSQNRRPCCATNLRFPGGQTERPANSSLYDVVMDPNLSTCVEFKLRTNAKETVF